jgi:exopolysaccharide production protein ExoQ
MDKVRNIFTILVIIYMTDVNLLPVNNTSTNDILKGNIITEIIATGIYIIVIGMLVTRWKYAIRISANNIFIWFVIFWVFASFLWSGESDLTLRRSAALLGTTIIGLYMASFYSYEQFTRIVGWSFLISSFLSLMVIILFPSQGIMLDPYGWKGIYSHKNSLGMISLCGVIIFPSLLSNKTKNIQWIVGFILSCITLIGSKSTTSIIVSAFAIFIWYILFAYINKLKPIYFFLIFSLMIIIVFGIWLYLTNNIEFVFNIFGKDSTFTGRTYIWDAVLQFIRQSPWLGYGYGAVWTGQDYGIGSDIASAINYYAVGAHNGYLELLLEIGIIGTTLVFLALMTTLYKLLNNLRYSNREIYCQIWPVVFLISLFFYNSTEAIFLVQNNIAWIFITFIGFSILPQKNTQSIIENKLWQSSRIHPQQL